MNNQETNRLETFLRVRQFGVTHAAQFPANSRGGEVFAELGAVISEIENITTAQDSGKRAVKESTSRIAAARAELIEDLKTIRRTARVLNVQGLEDKFRLPKHVRDQELLATARAFANDAAPLKGEFVRRGLPTDFLEDLKADINAFAQMLEGRTQKAGSKVAATAGIDEAIERGMNMLEELDAIVRNTFRNDAPTLAEWTSARHTTRATRHKTQTDSHDDQKTPPPDKPTPAPAA